MISGLLLVNKSKDMTSHEVVEKIRNILEHTKVGHFGTLDPMAEGLLLVGIGRATKFFDFYIQKRKLYSGTIKFGYATSTYDREGTPLSEKRKIDLSQMDLDPLFKEFTGEIQQVPPAYSAKKHKGRPLYKYARENKEIPINPVKVRVYFLRGKIMEPDTLWFETQTSAGTYVRSLAHDMGQKLGVGAYLDSLKRLSIGEFTLSDSISMEQLSDRIDFSALSKWILPIESLLPEFSKVIVTPAGKRGVINGVPLLPKEVIKIYPSTSKTHFRLFDEEGKLLAIARKDETHRQFNPFIVFPD
jgi:tRNA pseudouridine55 synthase